jgi:hypothetical protein
MAGFSSLALMKTCYLQGHAARYRECSENCSVEIPAEAPTSLAWTFAKKQRALHKTRRAEYLRTYIRECIRSGLPIVAGPDIPSMTSEALRLLPPSHMHCCRPSRAVSRCSATTVVSVVTMVIVPDLSRLFGNSSTTGLKTTTEPYGQGPWPFPSSSTSPLPQSSGELPGD